MLTSACPGGARPLELLLGLTPAMAEVKGFGRGLAVARRDRELAHRSEVDSDMWVWRLKWLGGSVSGFESQGV